MQPRTWISAAVLAAGTTQPAFAEVQLSLPLECTPNVDCFVQQGPDMDPGPGALDTFCGQATYDGHTGWDIRVRSARDAQSGVPVLAAAAGKVLRTRDGLEDRLTLTEEDRARVASSECGNGIVISHGSLETQYCHLLSGSVAVRPGDTVTQGQQIGMVGYSGAAAFPHVHLTVRKDGQNIDPYSGHSLASREPNCGAPYEGVFDKDTQRALVPGPVILGLGVTSQVPELNSLVVEGEAPIAVSNGDALIGWIWAINVEQGTKFEIRVTGPGGKAVVESISEPLNRRKAQYLSYGGRRLKPEPGKYTVTGSLVIGDTVILSQSAEVTVR